MGGSNISVIPSAMLIWARLATYTYLILTGGPTSALAESRCLLLQERLEWSGRGIRVVVDGAHIPFLKCCRFLLALFGDECFFVFFFCFSLVIDANQVYIHFLIYCHKWYLFRGRITPSPLFDHIYTVTQNNHSLICGR